MIRAVLVSLAASTTLWGALAASPASAADTTDPTPDPAPTTVTLSLPATSTYGQTVHVTATVTATTDDGTVPVPDARTSLQIAGSDWTTTATLTSDDHGKVAFTLTRPVGNYRVRAQVAATPAPDPTSPPTPPDPLPGGTTAGTSTVHPLRVNRATVTLTAANRTIVSERRTTVTVTLRSPTLPVARLAHHRVHVLSRPWGSPRYGGGHWVTTDAQARVSLRLTSWHGVRLRLDVPRLVNTLAARRTVQVTTRGQLSTVTQAGMAHPAHRFPAGRPPVGSGVHATSGTIPGAVWGRMVGVSWQSGCPTPRSRLRYVQLNYWGFDGYRHRGAIIVNKGIVGDTIAAFSDLYRQHFRIRRIEPVDAWGRGKLGPGADDYAAMRDDNTSGFNCRYVDGRERHHVWSPHAFGMAIDVNTFENPYVAPTGTFPDTYWLHHRRGAGVLARGSAATRAFTSHGFFWGANWHAPDFQHFEK